MEKRVVVFLVLSLAIIFGYEYVLTELGLLPKSTVSAPSDQTPAEGSSPAATDQGPEAHSPSPNTGSEKPTPTPSTNDAKADAGPEELALAETIDVETDLYRAKFIARGAALTSWELTRYRSTSDPDAAVQLVRQGGKFTEPLVITTDDATVTKELGHGIYHVTKDFTTLDQDHPTGHLTFSYDNPGTGIRLEKRLTFHAGSYVVDIEVIPTGLPGSVKVGLGTNFGVVDWGEGFIGSVGAASLVDDKVEKGMPDSELERTGSVKWAALQDKYFISALIPTGGSSTIAKNQGDKLVSTAVRMPIDASGVPLHLQLFAGPKEYDTLEILQIGLEDTIDFGWFLFGSWDTVRAIAKPIFYVLRSINEYTHNYGLTIILLTVGIKVLFVPLQYKSYKSMKQMQSIQPKVAALQEKFKDDRERLNKELIKVYRDHKVNPVGGCLPMVLQMPVFVALFNILYMTIDLRQAPLGLWISDLSVQDPYYILPVIMGVSMFVMQKIQPTTMDPNQAKIMLMLPVFMTFLFINFPAGLVLYWLTNNVLSIVQQFVTDRFFFKNRPILPSVEEADGKKA
ncbi:MAG: membrane protein insertase YidC [Nitrospira sp.]|nr:membrane protein insertase YidC [Nitrospira sp.]MDH4370359.1 membrane protein insertase YidC [Nitrospira sp.]MDH5346671.1 membrane protein insertase YidC [Nitrospira sp.]MDH5497419.1 membrane protein insertase YidC [Nitrospira sp.]MDH5726685.1 membrane protein insertase YidC [Nitrospira sp.]